MVACNGTMQKLLITLCAVRVMCLVVLLVWVTKKHPFTHLLVKYLCKKDAQLYNYHTIYNNYAVVLNYIYRGVTAKVVIQKSQKQVISFRDGWIDVLADQVHKDVQWHSTTFLQSTVTHWLAQCLFSLLVECSNDVTAHFLKSTVNTAIIMQQNLNPIYLY